MNTTAYCRDTNGKLMSFAIEDVSDFQEAIDVVKQECRARVVLCVVPKAQPQEQVAA